ncbi:MAG: cytochrome C oxidase subunit IV family protein [Anaerolineae bacterium]|nr:cytochrome C oxidase subunit IV family protein [Anaerolineae bacterium]
MAEEHLTTPVAPAHEEPKAAHGPKHYDEDKTVIFGRELPFPVYTVVYGGLALLTLIEVGISQVSLGFLTIPLLLLIAFFKAGLVVWFYMHLNTDSRIFAITLIIPLVMVIIATLFLMIVPTGY